MRTRNRSSFKTISFTFCLSVIIILNCGNALSQLDWPRVTEETKPWSRWWWMGSIVNEQDLTSEMEKYAEAGLGGLEMTPIYGVQGDEDRFIDYLSEDWMNMFLHVLKEADRLGLGIDMATGNGWPFGGPWIGADHACKNVHVQTYQIKGGGHLDGSVTLIQEPMARAVGRRIDISEIREPISANENLQALAFEQVRFPQSLPLQLLMAYSDRGEALNITDRVDDKDNLDWTAPAGQWTLYAIFQGWHGKMVERAGPGGEGNVIDHFSRDALKSYLERFDQAFTGYDISALRAFFNDSYEVDDASGESDWTGNILDEFETRRGYDLTHHLPALFGNDTEDKNRRVLCDFRETISDLLLDAFTIPWGEWAAQKGAITRNQAHGSPANILDLYAASTIPETEGNDILRFKFASSTAHVTGKPLASCEAATWLNEHFQSSLGDVKQIADLFFLGGINHVCYHGTTFSPPHETWPGWMFYASVHFGPTNTFWDDFSTLNQYVTRCQSFLQSGKPDNNILLYFPIFDIWSERGRSLLQHVTGSGLQSMTAAFQTAASAMIDQGYALDYISDKQLDDVKVSGKSLLMGNAAYQTVVVPACQFMPLETFEKLVALAKEGAVIIVHQNLPADVPGLGRLEEKRQLFQNLIQQLTFTETENEDVLQAKIGTGMVLLGENLDRLLQFAQVRRESMVDLGLEYIRRTDGKHQIYFIVNPLDAPVEGWIPLQTPAQTAAIFDPMTGEKGTAALRKYGEYADIYLQLPQDASCIVKGFDEIIESPSFKYIQTDDRSMEIKGPWEVQFIKGGPELPNSIQTDTLMSWTDFHGEEVKIFSGTAQYVTTFPKPDGDGDTWLLDLGQVNESACVILNGENLGTTILSPFQIHIPKELMKDENRLEIDVSNLMANRIADLDRRGVQWKKFYNINFSARRPENRGEDGVFNASRWPPRPSGLIGPVILKSITGLNP
ncbi:glycoside hydrolase family 2 protein [bacterium]|nr:glycoside hydrolase family 2 protein [bacterium]